MNNQWYPGHMTKTRRMIAEQIKNVDAVCEILAARIPVSSRNPDVDELTAGKPRMVVLNRRGYGGVSGYDFWVNIPVALLDEIDTDRVRAVVDSYKLASKRYQINFV